MPPASASPLGDIPSQIEAAIYKDDLATVTSLITQNPTALNASTRFGSPLLVTAVRSGKQDILSFLLDKGADVNSLGLRGPSPLNAAIQNGSLDNVTLLIKKGAKVNEADSDGTTPLKAALQGWNGSKIFQLLLDSGATVDPPKAGAKSLLQTAIENSSQPEIIGILLDRTQDINTLGPDGNSILHTAVNRGNLDVVKLLLSKGMSVDLQSANGETPLMVASRNRNSQISEFLIDNKANVNLRDKRGETALHILLRGSYIPASLGSGNASYYLYRNTGSSSVDTNSVQIISLLMDHNARTDIADQYGLTATQYALVNRNKLALALLPSTQTNVVTKFLVAVSGDDVPEVTAMLRAHPYLSSVRLSTGTTPLHIAALWGAKNVASILLQSGADVNVRDAYAQAPIHLAASAMGNVAMLKFLIAHGASIASCNSQDATPLHLAAADNDLDMVQALIDSKAPVNAVDQTGTPLQCIDADKGTDIAAALLSAGADPNIGAGNGRNLLTDAIQAKNVPLVKMLIAKGVQINPSDQNGGSPPLMTAINNRDVDMVKLLLNSGADVVFPRWGQNALQVARNNQNQDIIDLIKARMTSLGMSSADATTN